MFVGRPARRRRGRPTPYPSAEPGVRCARRRRRTIRPTSHASASTSRIGPATTRATSTPPTIFVRPSAAALHASPMLQPPPPGRTGRDAAFGQLQRDRGEGALVVEVGEPASYLLELELHVVEPSLHGECLGNRLRALQEAEQLRLDRLEVTLAGLQIDELAGDVLSGLLARADPAELRELRHRLAVGGFRHPEDERSADEPAVGALARAGARDVARKAGRDRSCLRYGLLEAGRARRRYRGARSGSPAGRRSA